MSGIIHKVKDAVSGHSSSTSNNPNTSTTTNHGPHNTNVGNTVDPRVDSDRDGRSAFGTSHSTNHGPHDSNLANKADPRFDSDRDGRAAHGTTGLTGSHNTHGTTGLTGSHNTHGTTGLTGSHNTHTSTAGPHNSDLLNKADPRVDSDRDGRSGLGSTGHGTTGLTGSHNTHGTTGLTGASTTHGTTGYGTTGSTNHGPHDSNLANKADPRFDSDRDGRAAHGTTGTGFGTSHTAGTSTNAGPHNSNLLNQADPRVDSDRDGRAAHGTTGFGTTGAHSTHTSTAGPHNSNLLNKADPRVDSDRDGRSGLGSTGHGTTGTTGTYGTSHSTNAGPHNSAALNKMDPRVDSDRDGSHNVGGHSTGLHSNAPHTAGPHKSDLANKIDPRVDSDLDGSKTFGGNKTFSSAELHLRGGAGDPDEMMTSELNGHQNNVSNISPNSNGRSRKSFGQLIITPVKEIVKRGKNRLKRISSDCMGGGHSSDDESGAQLNRDENVEGGDENPNSNGRNPNGQSSNEESSNGPITNGHNSNRGTTRIENIAQAPEQVSPEQAPLEEDAPRRTGSIRSDSGLVLRSLSSLVRPSGQSQSSLASPRSARASQKQSVSFDLGTARDDTALPPPLRPINAETMTPAQAQELQDYPSQGSDFHARHRRRGTTGRASDLDKYFEPSSTQDGSLDGTQMNPESSAREGQDAVEERADPPNIILLPGLL